jgi:hypothetical protein
MSNEHPDVVLIAFGEHQLGDLVKEAEEGQEGVRKLATIPLDKGNPPHFRTRSACTVAQQETFRKYLDIMADFIQEGLDEIAEGEENNG